MVLATTLAVEMSGGVCRFRQRDPRRCARMSLRSLASAGSLSPATNPRTRSTRTTGPTNCLARSLRTGIRPGR